MSLLYLQFMNSEKSSAEVSKGFLIQASCIHNQYISFPLNTFIINTISTFDRQLSAYVKLIISQPVHKKSSPAFFSSSNIEHLSPIKQLWPTSTMTASDIQNKKMNASLFHGSSYRQSLKHPPRHKRYFPYKISISTSIVIIILAVKSNLLHLFLP